MTRNLKKWFLDFWPVWPDWPDWPENIGKSAVEMPVLPKMTKSEEISSFSMKMTKFL